MKNVIKKMLFIALAIITIMFDGYMTYATVVVVTNKTAFFNANAIYAFATATLLTTMVLILKKKVF